MPKIKPLHGRVLALVGLLLVALNLRTAVSSLSPIIPFIREDLELSTLAVSFLGMLPPLGFALSGLLGPMRFWLGGLLLGKTPLIMS